MVIRLMMMNMWQLTINLFIFDMPGKSICHRLLDNNIDCWFYNEIFYLYKIAFKVVCIKLV